MRLPLDIWSTADQNLVHCVVHDYNIIHIEKAIFSKFSLIYITAKLLSQSRLLTYPYIKFPYAPVAVPKLEY